MKNLSNELHFSNAKISANHTYKEKKNEAGDYQDRSSGRSFQSVDCIYDKAWEPHVHALQELVPLISINVNSFPTGWQALMSNLGLITQPKSKIGCSRVNNTLSIKTSELKKVYLKIMNTHGTNGRSLSPVYKNTK